jgi:hypothetical protein
MAQANHVTRLPGFTAQASLYRGGAYAATARASGARAEAVVPQAWPNSKMGWCMAGGGSLLECWYWAAFLS